MKTSKTTKRALLSSVLALVLCFAMLLGTTFAWFTDTASTSVNKIQAGTLKVKLEDANDNDLEGKTLSWKKAAEGSSQEILWEPGCTYELEPVTIKNDGNLAFKFKVEVTGIGGNAKLNEAIDWTISTTEASAVAGSTGEYYLIPDQEATLTISGTMKTTAGNEYQGLSIDGAAITVFATQYTYEYDSNNNTYDALADYGTAADNAPDRLDDTGDVTAAPEKDTETGVYHITSASEFVQYINELNNDPSHGAHRYDSAKVVLDTNIDLGGYEFTASDEGWAFDGQFDGQNHTVSNFSVTRTDGEYYTGLFSVYMSDLETSKEVFIKNLTVKNATITSNGKQVAAIVPSVYANATVDNCHAIDCIVTGVKKVGAVVGYVENGTVKDCSAKDCSVYATNNDSADATLFGYNNGGTFTNNSDKGGNTVLANTTTISSASELSTFAAQDISVVNSQNVVLLADIDMSGIAWTPLCDSHTQYNGTFDGNGHTIKNLTITESDDAIDNAGIGFIAWLNGTVKNLTLDNANVSGYHWVGAIVGYNQVGTIENCTVKNSNITGTHKSTGRCGDKVGAVVGYCNGDARAKVLNCTASNCEVKAARDAGQIVGCIYSNVVTVTGNTASGVTVSATTGCSDEDAGHNITNDIIGRVAN